MNATVEDDWAAPMPGVRILKRGRKPVRRIQVYGQRCSGTHAIIKLIEANFGREAYTEAYGFKHWFVPRQTLFHEDVLVLVVAREPFEWAQALHRQPWHVHPRLRGQSFSDFIRSEWHAVWDGEFWGVDEHHPVIGTEMEHERDPGSGDRFVNAIAKRTAKLRHWCGIEGRAHNVALLDQMTLRDRPAEVIASLAEATGLAPIGPFVPIDTYKGHGIKPYAPTVYPPVAPSDRAHIREWLDPAIERRFGFAV